VIVMYIPTYAPHAECTGQNKLLIQRCSRYDVAFIWSYIRALTRCCAVYLDRATFLNTAPGAYDKPGAVAGLWFVHNVTQLVQTGGRTVVTSSSVHGQHMWIYLPVVAEPAGTLLLAAWPCFCLPPSVHHHHQITKLSHSINAIGPAPHRHLL
jgi:hypothetical protein